MIAKGRAIINLILRWFDNNIFLMVSGKYLFINVCCCFEHLLVWPFWVDEHHCGQTLTFLGQ